MTTPSDGGAPPRRDTASTRAFHMRRILRGRATGYAFSLGIVGAVVAGAWLRSAVVMAVAPVVVTLLVLGAAYRAADRRAEREFFLSFANARGLRYIGDTSLLPLTPLLGAGDRREWSHWMQGPVGPRMPEIGCGLGHYTWYETGKDADTPRWIPHQFTVCVVDLESGITLFPGIFLVRNRILDGLFGGGWLSTGTRHKVELESARLHERYDLWIERSQDELLLRQLFSPSFVAWLAEHPLEPCFEYRAGTLVVYLERRLEDAGRLGWLLDATEEIAGRLVREVEQARAGHAARVAGY